MNACDSVLGSAFERGLAQAPAVISSGVSYSFAQVRQEVGRHANALHALGIAPGARVVLLLPDSLALVAAHLGTMAAGAVAVTLSLRLSPDELTEALRDSGCSLVLVDAGLQPRFSQALSAQDATWQVYSMHGKISGLPAWEAFCAEQSPEFTAVNMPPSAMAFWIYTSGTTGELKACVHRHESVIPARDYLTGVLGVRAGMKVYATSKLFFAYALGTCLFGAFQAGATVVLDADWPTPRSVLDILVTHAPDVVFSVPAMYRALLRSGVAHHPAFRAPRLWVCAGEKLSRSVHSQWAEVTGARIIEGMGASESIYMILTNFPDDAQGGSAGYPAPGVTAELRGLDGERLDLPGGPGMLWARMPSVSREYWRRPELTRRVLREGWFVTGDLFTVDRDGRWRHQGRQEDRFRMGETWVNPADIEDTLTNLAEVADAAVNKRAHVQKMGVYLVAAPGVQETQVAKAAHAALGREWPGIADHVDVLVIPELPRTASGKVQRHRLEPMRRFASETPQRQNTKEAP